MKSLKVVIMLAITLAMFMCGCGAVISSGVTPKQIIDNEEITIGYYMSGDITEETIPTMFFVFQNGEATVYRGEQDALGELAKMTDEEIIELLKDREQYHGTASVTIYSEFLTNKVLAEQVDVSVKMGVSSRVLSWMLDVENTDFCSDGKEINGSTYYGYNALVGDGSITYYLCFRTDAQNFELGFDSANTPNVKIETVGGF